MLITQTLLLFFSKMIAIDTQKLIIKFQPMQVRQAHQFTNNEKQAAKKHKKKKKKLVK
jgi:hypothetical protein